MAITHCLTHCMTMPNHHFVFLLLVWLSYYFSQVEGAYGDITSMAGDGYSATATLIIGSGTSMSGAFNVSCGTYSDGSGTSATFGQPYGLSIDSSNNVYIADRINHRVRKLTYTTGIISTVAGNGVTSVLASSQRTVYASSSDNGFATSASLSYLQGVAVDLNGNL